MAKLTTLKPRLQSVGNRLATVNPDSWRQDKNSSQRGYGYKWQKARADYLKEHPFCVYCSREGYDHIAATVVDHIVPHRGDMKLFWDRSNWAALCSHCHSSTKQREESKAR